MRIQNILLVVWGVLGSTFAAVTPNAPHSRVSPASAQAKVKHDTKYFHEPGANEILGHYDIRYFTGSPVSYEVKAETLKFLIRSYLTTFREKNIKTWIAHGTLLGWWWNGKIMPWDWDLDVQVPASTLVWLGENMNMTFHNYTLPGPNGTTYEREFLLDINPNSKERLRGDGQNVIDARWIDTKTGLFIDITGLSETNPTRQPGIWSCKNYHHYKTKEIYPLRETIFEGVPALVPYDFDRILTAEYSRRALTNTFHEGHKWMPEQKEWVKQQAPTFNKPPAQLPGKGANTFSQTPKPLNVKPGLDVEALHP